MRFGSALDSTTRPGIVGDNPRATGYTPFMPALSLRVVILLIVGWANVYCCCPAPAAPVQSDQQTSKPACCAHKHSTSLPDSSPRSPERHRCDECPYLALRQTTITAQV